MKTSSVIYQKAKYYQEGERGERDKKDIYYTFAEKRVQLERSIAAWKISSLISSRVVEA